MDLQPASTLQAPESRRSSAADFLVLLGILALLFGAMEMGREWHHPFERAVEIDLSPWMLPYYASLSLARATIAYGFSIVFTLLYARWAAYDRKAERVLIPLLDILQSIPFLAFLTPLELALVGLFPHSNFGLEMTCVLIIFTSQVWNMTFSFYYSLKCLPADFVHIGRLARFTPWQRFTQIEIPFGMKGLVYNSMVSIAGGWFFLTVSEAFTLGGLDFRLPGLGSYMSEAQAQNNGWAQFSAVVTMLVMIIALDQFLWRPLLIWSNKFKIEETDAEHHEQSFVLRWLNRSRLASSIGNLLDHWLRRQRPLLPTRRASSTAARKWTIPWRMIFLTIAGVATLLGLEQLVLLLWRLTPGDWITIGIGLVLTLLRVLAAIALSTIIAVPIGIWIGSHPRWARFLMPVTQIAASFPAPMVFPNLVFLIFLVGGNLQWGAIILMMLGTIWYILFNVIAGANALPQDLIACAELTRLHGWQKWRTLYLPGIFPALTTGWITAAGGAWNASIVSEYVQYHNAPQSATGLGALISEASNAGNTPLLAGSVLAMALFVVFFNRTVWKRLSAIARERYQLLT